MKKQIELNEQIMIVKTFLIHNTNSNKKINYKKTSYSWALEVSKWAGVEIKPYAINEACKSYDIRTVEISKGVSCFGIETMK